MPPILSKNSVLKTKPRKMNASNMQMPATQRRKTYSELPMIDIQNSYNNIPVINAPAQFAKELRCFFPNDLERSFHLGLLSACAAPQHSEELRNSQSSDSAARHENKMILKDYISSLNCEQNALDCNDGSPTLFNEQNAHQFMTDGKVHQTYMSRKRTSKSGEQYSAAKRILTCGVAEDIAFCQVTEFNSTKEISTDCENTLVLPQHHTKGKPEPNAFCSALAEASEHGNVSAVSVLSKRQKRVTFADVVDERQVSECEEFCTSQQADSIVKYISSKERFCEADEQPMLTSDVDECPDDPDFSDPPFPLSQKYGMNEVTFEDWKSTEQDDLQEVKLYEDYNAQ